MPLSQLKSILSPPESPSETGSLKGWKEVEKRLGLTLPTDYKAFIDCYGTGSIDTWILVYNPFAVDDTFNLFQALDLHHQASRRVARMARGGLWSVVDPFHLYPAPGGLLPWGTTTSFQVAFFWHLEGKPDSWSTLVYDLRQGAYEVWKAGFSCFLYQLLSCEIESLLLPEVTPLKTKKVKFHPYEEEEG